jgi:hypothetical protein
MDTAKGHCAALAHWHREATPQRPLALLRLPTPSRSVFKLPPSWSLAAHNAPVQPRAQPPQAVGLGSRPLQANNAVPNHTHPKPANGPSRGPASAIGVTHWQWDGGEASQGATGSLGRVGAQPSRPP